MCKVSSGSVQWDCEQFPQSKSGELGREQQGLCSHHPGGTLSSSLPPEPYCAGLDSIISGGPFQPIQFCDSVWYYKGKGIHTLASCIAEAYILQNWAQHTMKWSYLKNEETFKMQGEMYALQVILSPPWEQGLPVPWILTARNEFFLCGTSH